MSRYKKLVKCINSLLHLVLVLGVGMAVWFTFSFIFLQLSLSLKFLKHVLNVSSKSHKSYHSRVRDHELLGISDICTFHVGS